MQKPNRSAEQLAEKLELNTSGAEARTEDKGFNAALKALRHPKSRFLASALKQCGECFAITRFRTSCRRHQ
jgi:hypothetical protein